MAALGNTLFDQTYKKYYEKEKKKRLDFRIKIQVIKPAILLSFYKVARPQIFLILHKQCCTIQLISTEACNKLR